MENVLLILIISVLGSLIGSFIGVWKKPSEQSMVNMLSFAAGVMISISFLELIPESILLSSIAICMAGVFLGFIVIYSIDKLLPHIHPTLGKNEGKCNYKKTAIYLIIGIFMHNFPEGMAIAIGLTTGLKLGLAIAISIAIHHIPEGICTSAPYYYSTKKRMKAFLMSSSTAIPTLAGFAFAYAISGMIPMWFVGMLMAATAGIMIYISADELIPLAYAKEGNHGRIFSFAIGIFLVLAFGFI